MRLMTLVVLFLLASCAPGSGDGEPGLGEPRAGPADFEGHESGPRLHLAETASWQGVLPCADCAGIRTTLILQPDGTYRRQDAYLGLAPEPDTLFGEMGRWTLRGAGDRITLYGSGELPGMFAVLADGSLRMLDEEGREIESALPYSLDPLPGAPQLMAPLRMTGAFTYMADVALFVECRSGIQLPVAMTEGYLPLERAYMEWRAEPLDPMLIRVRGTVEDFPAMEGDGTEEVLVVESFQVADQGIACPALELGESLASGEWWLKALHGAAVAIPAAGEVPTLQWEPEESRLAGSAGCNQFTARGFLRGTLLVTEEIAVTRRYCPGAMELEGQFLGGLGAGGALRVEEGTLVLYQGPEDAARFFMR